MQKTSFARRVKTPHDTPERTAFRDTIHKYVNDHIKPHADQWDEAGEIPWHIHEDLGGLGAFGFGVDETYGGLGFDDCFMRKAFCEEMAQCGANGVLAAVTGRMISIGPIHALGTEEQKQMVLPSVVSGKTSSCLCITEPSGGSDVANVRTTAKRQGNHYVINGQKTFITSGMTSEHFVVAARTGTGGLKGISLFLVHKDSPGFSRTPLSRKMGWWASDQATLYFDNCKVPASAMLGEEDHGFVSIMQNFNLERVSLTAQALGMMRVCLDESIAWATDRETFGKQLIKHQVIRHKIAEISARIDVTEAYLNAICFAINDGDMPVAEISKAKFFTTKALEYCASEAMQILGGAGYLRGNVVERVYREVKVLSIGGGSEEIMRDLAARQMGL